MIRNKKASDRILSMYWFLIILLISVAIFAMVYLFYSAPYEVRDLESKILASKIADCLSYQGVLHQGVLSSTQGQFNNDFDLLRDCNLNFQVEDEYDWKQEEQYFSEVEIYHINDPVNPGIIYSNGNLNWKPHCFLKDKKQQDYGNLVKCHEERVYSLGPNSEQYLIKILVGVGKIEKNARE
jgi:hypothetical protein